MRVISEIKAALKEKGFEGLNIKTAGRMTVEVCVAGVDKALPLNYLARHFDEILDMMGYSSGNMIDARKTRTVLAVDFDGTLAGKPAPGKMPILRWSPAREDLLAYLKAGGLVLVNSGNRSDRIERRLREDHGLPEEFKKSVIVAVKIGRAHV